MSEDENFLSRWSRRKQEVAKEAKLEEKPAAEPQGAEATPEAPAKQEDALDLTKLPPLEEITAETDISAFLRQGVPTDLARAALRRAWTSDPAIRDFVGLQENDWVFNKPGPEQGFGPLDPTTDVRKLLAQVFGEGPKDEPATQSNAASMGAERTPLDKAGAKEASDPHGSHIASVPIVKSSDDDAPHNKEDDARPPRSHGGTLPRPIPES